MGSACSCGADMSDEFQSDALYGIEDTNVTESYQYHRDKIKEYSVTLSYYDKFYRTVCGPLHLF